MKKWALEAGLWATEVCAMAAAGTAALAFPVLTGQAVRGHHAGFAPFIRDVVEGVQPSSLGLLLLVALTGGLAGRAPPVLLGCASAAVLPLWSAIDMAMGGGGHNLLPFEWLAYAFYMALGTIGSAVGRGVRIRFKAKRAR